MSKGREEEGEVGEVREGKIVSFLSFICPVNYFLS